MFIDYHQGAMHLPTSSLQDPHCSQEGVPYRSCHSGLPQWCSEGILHRHYYFPATTPHSYVPIHYTHIRFPLSYISGKASPLYTSVWHVRKLYTLEILDPHEVDVFCGVDVR